MDEILYRSSQRYDNLQVQIELATIKTKEVIRDYTNVFKEVVHRSWDSPQVEELRVKVRELITQIIELTKEVQYKVSYFVDPRRLYKQLAQLLSKKLTKRDVCVGLFGVLIGILVGLALGLSLRSEAYGVNYMQAVQCKHFLGIESACVVEDAVAPTVCGDHDVLVNVKAASVHVIDAHICAGYGRNIGRILRNLYRQSNDGVILGRACSGVIVDLGKKVKRLEVGDEVWLTVPFWCQGTLCQTILINEGRVARKPETIEFEGACSLPYSGSLALNALKRADINEETAKDKKILIQGGCTPVGCVLIQLLKHWNAQVSTTCYKRTVPLAKALGAEDIIVLPNNEETSQSPNELPEQDDQLDLKALFKEIDNRAGQFDVIFNTQSGNFGPQLLQNLLMPSKPTLVVSTFHQELLTDECGPISNVFVSIYIRIKYYLCKLFGASMSDFDEAHLCHVSLEELADLVEDGYLKTVVDRIYHPQDIEIALHHIQSPQAIGSTVITFR